MFIVSERWSKAYPSGMVAVLTVRGVANVAQHPELERRKRVLEQELQARFRSRDDIRSDGVMQAYIAYYRRFEKTYHLLQQLQTLVLKQKPLPIVSGLVDVMFMAEMRHLLLTAGHDFAKVVPPVTLEAARGDETYVKLNQEPQVAKSGDMMVVDRDGILSSVIHGPDLRSRITLATTDAMYVVYAPVGVAREQVVAHVRDIAEGILSFAPGATVEPVQFLSAKGVAAARL
jgi:DNA/RNA-binding domain of Phe-tRNA-synthetase-like protein